MENHLQYKLTERRIALIVKGEFGTCIDVEFYAIVLLVILICEKFRSGSKNAKAGRPCVDCKGSGVKMSYR